MKKSKIFHSVFKFAQNYAKTCIRALDKVIIYIAMSINENYNSNMYCCMINKQLIKLSTLNIY